MSGGNDFKERVKAFSGRAEEVLNGKIRGSKFSWGFVVIACGMVWALIEILNFLLIFFK